uniref:Novel immune-type receptor 3b n=1 Tax=Cyprinus carpio TaxID=7962 RepID=A0A8C2EW35_CYPCA
MIAKLCRLYLYFLFFLCCFNLVTKLIAELGSSVIIPCSHSDDYINTVLWYKHSVGKKPLLIAYSEHGSGSVTYQNGFNNTNRYFIRSEPDSFNLTIVHLEEYDFVTYYCAVSFLNMITFGEGTILLHKGEFMTISELHSGDSVTLQCSVISQICAGEYRVYWFRHSSGHSDPGIIYTHDNRSDQCMERSESSSSIQSCVYSLSQTELTPSDAGIYYCAVATCGKIHLGNGTKLIIEVLMRQKSKTTKCLHKDSKSLSLWGHFLVPMRKTTYKTFFKLKIQNVLCKGIESLYSIKTITSMEYPHKTWIPSVCV